MDILIAILVIFLVLLIADKLEPRLGKFGDIFWIVVVILLVLWLFRGGL